MASNLRDQLSSLAAGFADSVHAAVRAASLEELQSESSAHLARGTAAPRPAGERPGRLSRRSAVDIEAALGRVLGLLRGKRAGLRSEEIRAALRLDRRELPRVLRQGLAKKMIHANGRKRATVYRAR